MDGLRARTLVRRVRPEDRLHRRLIGPRIGLDDEAVNFVSADVPDADPTAAGEQVGADGCKMARHLSSGCSRPGLVLEQQPSGIENDVAVEEKIEKETMHGQSHLVAG